MALQPVPENLDAEHEPICGTCGEAWPCSHHRAVSRFRYVERMTVHCMACGKVRSGCGILCIESGFDGRAVFFHNWKRCRPAARAWWAEHVEPLTGKGFLHGQWIGSLVQYVAVRRPMRAVESKED